MSVTAFCSRELQDAIGREGLDTVAGAFAYRGGHDMTRAGLGHRAWIRLELACPSGAPRLCFMKRYEREPLAWRVRRVLAYGWRKSPAGVELANVRTLKQAGIPSIDEAFCGEEFDSRGAKRSYIIVSAVEGAALEQCLDSFLARHENDAATLQQFCRELAGLIGSLHRLGYVHRDMYTSHVFMAERADGFRLALIDLARMMRPRVRTFRWRVKDLAQMKYSLPQAWSARWWDEFLTTYAAAIGAAGWREKFAKAVDRKLAGMRRRLGRRERKKA